MLAAFLGNNFIFCNIIFFYEIRNLEIVNSLKLGETDPDGLLIFTDVALSVCKMQHNLKKFLVFIMSPSKKMPFCPLTRFVSLKFLSLTHFEAIELNED